MIWLFFCYSMIKKTAHILQESKPKEIIENCIFAPLNSNIKNNAKNNLYKD